MAFAGEGKTFLDRMQARLQGWAALTYNEVVDVGEYRRDALPDFDRYAIILDLVSETESSEVSCVNTKRKIWKVNVVALVRKFGALAKYGYTLPNVGICYHIDQIKDALRFHKFGAPPPGFTSGGYIDVKKRELDGEVVISSFEGAPSENRANFYFEVVIPFVGEGRETYMPAVT